MIPRDLQLSLGQLDIAAGDRAVALGRLKGLLDGKNLSNYQQLILAEVLRDLESCGFRLNLVRDRLQHELVIARVFEERLQQSNGARDRVA